MISVLPLPAARAARMNSRGQIASAPARATRAKTGMLKMPMAMMALIAPGPKMAVIMIADSRAGKAKTRSLKPHQRFVDEAAARRGKGAERHADAHADADRDKRHGDRVAGADHDHRQDVAAEMVGAEPVRQRGRLRLVGDDQFGDVVGRPEEGDERHRRHQRRDGEADEEGAVAERLGQDAAEGLLRDVDVQRHCRLLRRGSTTA